MLLPGWSVAEQGGQERKHPDSLSKASEPGHGERGGERLDLTGQLLQVGAGAAFRLQVVHQVLQLCLLANLRLDVTSQLQWCVSEGGEKV